MQDEFFFDIDAEPVTGDPRVRRRLERWVSFERARSHARTLHRTTRAQWFEYAKSDDCPRDIPCDPERVYKEEFEGYPDFLDCNPETGSEKRFRDFESARSLVHELKLASSTEYRQWAGSEKCPTDIPYHPNKTYRYEWKDWEDFLGESHDPRPARPSLFYSYAEASALAQKLSLKSLADYKAYIDSKLRDPKMPARPATKYKEEWKGIASFLGITPVASRSKARTLVSFTEAKKIVREELATDERDYRSRIVPLYPDRLPSQPHNVYSDDWKGWNDYLGTEPRSGRVRSKGFLPFEAARDLARKERPGSIAGYKTWVAERADLPRCPNAVYADKGWAGWPDFLLP